MKKIGLGVLVLITVLVASGIALASVNGQAGQRVYVLTDNPVIKAILGVRHEFPGAFSTDVSPQLKVLASLGLIKTEPVRIFYLVDNGLRPKGKPVCGDGIAHPSEQCGEPGLPPCPDGYVCENCKCVKVSLPPERTCYPDNQYPWGIVKVNGGSGGAGVTVTVLDTGVYKDHLDLDVKLCKDATKKGIKDGCDDFHGHGTHTSGTVAANGGADGLGIFGVAPEANLWHVKVCKPFRGSAICWGDDIAAAINYVTDQGTNIISISLGGDEPDPEIKNAIDYAVSKDVLVIAAAGNDREEGIGSIDYPAAYAKVVAVAAFDSSDAMAAFSSLGVNDGDWVIEEKEIEFAAPGVSVESTYLDGCYAYGSGTSMSAPHVAGIAARDWKGSASTTRDYLQDLAKYYTENVYDYGQVGDDIEAGFGLPITP